jgi:hypothetical protein
MTGEDKVGLGMLSVAGMDGLHETIEDETKFNTWGTVIVIADSDNGLETIEGVSKTNSLGFGDGVVNMEGADDNIGKGTKADSSKDGMRISDILVKPVVTGSVGSRDVENFMEYDSRAQSLGSGVVAADIFGRFTITNDGGKVGVEDGIENDAGAHFSRIGFLAVVIGGRPDITRVVARTEPSTPGAGDIGTVMASSNPWLNTRWQNQHQVAQKLSRSSWRMAGALMVGNIRIPEDIVKCVST